MVYDILPYQLRIIFYYTSGVDVNESSENRNLLLLVILSYSNIYTVFLSICD